MYREVPGFRCLVLLSPGDRGRYCRHGLVMAMQWSRRSSEPGEAGVQSPSLHLGILPQGTNMVRGEGPASQVVMSCTGEIWSFKL
jgi:hypothetical protein